MKPLMLLLILALVGNPTLADDVPSTHGMLLFGEAKTYLSHLPMFHPPHDYQAIAEISLPPAIRAAYLADRAQHPNERIYTLVPERFSLPKMFQSPRPFRAVLYRGHFERGGVAFAESQGTLIRKVIHFKKLNPSGTAPTQASYLLFGQPGERFAAHLITGAPDFDLVASVESSAPPQSPVTLPALPNETPLSEGQTYTSPSGATLSVKRVLYLEFDDLKP